MTLAKIISGGQTGVDRGALDAALVQNFPCGGWCPPGRMAEDGPIDKIYPLSEMNYGSYGERTRQNVIDSDGTVIIFFGELEGGTKVTLQFCRHTGKPFELINGGEISEQDAAMLIRQFIESYSINVLNVAGPRQSKAPEGNDYTYKVMSNVIESILVKQGGFP
jgi:hypothetical protein